MKRTAAESWVLGFALLLGLLEGQMAHGPPVCSWLDESRPVGRHSFVACIASLGFRHSFWCH